MLSRCHHWEVGKELPPVAELTDRLAKLAHTEALLVLSKTSFSSDWERGEFCSLVQGPSRYIRAYFLVPAPVPGLQWARQLGSDWLLEFKALRSLALDGGSWRGRADQLVDSIRSQLAWEEAEMFPDLTRFLGLDRPVREMGYEHDGIRRFLPGFPEALESGAGSRCWERFSLDLIHLLEHHIEHEQGGLYPVFERLLKEGKGVRQVQ